MNLDYQYHLPGNFDAGSRVWVYQSSRLFGLAEALDIETRLKDFVENWQSHGVPVKGAARLFFGQFIVLIADETATGVSGCSTDSSVRLIKQIESVFGVNMFDRTTLAFVVHDKVELLPLAQVGYAAENGYIRADTLYFNNLVQTLDALRSQWLIPAGESWLAKKISFPHTVS